MFDCVEFSHLSDSAAVPTQGERMPKPRPSQTFEVRSASAVQPSPRPAKSQSAPASKIGTAIAAHRAAMAEIDRTYNDVDNAETELDRHLSAHPIMAPVTLAANNQSPKGWYEVHKYGRDEISETIRNAHADLRKIHLSNAAKAFFPETSNQIEAAIDLSEQRALSELDEAYKRLDAAKDTVGLTSARKSYEAAEKAERETFFELLICPCQSPHETAEKAAYLAELHEIGQTTSDRGDTLLRAILAFSDRRARQ